MSVIKRGVGQSSAAVLLAAFGVAIVAIVFHRDPLEPAVDPTKAAPPSKRQTPPENYESESVKSHENTSRPLEQIRGFVSYVQDGDSLLLKAGDEEKTIRLWGIDSPEGNSKQPYAEQARDFTRRLCQRKQVEVVIHDTDRYHRLVGEVILPSGENANKAIVLAGLAWHYRQHAPQAKAFADAEAEARQAHRGLWAGMNPIPPWECAATTQLIISNVLDNTCERTWSSSMKATQARHQFTRTQ